MSDSNQVELSYIKETTYAETPTTPAFQEIGYKSESLKNNTGSTDSQQVRASRESAGKIQTSLTCGGDIVVEMQPDTYSELFEGLLQTDATWAAPTGGDALTQIVAADLAITASTPLVIGKIASAAQDLSTIKKGMFLKMQGDVTAIYIAAKDGTAADCEVSGVALEHVGTGLAVTIDACEEIRNGTAQPSYTIQKEFQDLDVAAPTNTDQEFHYLTGMTVGVFSTSISPENIIDGTFTFQGEKMVRQTTAIAGSSVTAYTDQPKMDAITSVKAVLVDPDTVTTAANAMREMEVTELGFNMSNNLRDRLVVGKRGPTSIGAGQIAIEGNLTAFFDNEFGKKATELLQSNIDFSDGRVLFTMTDKDTGEGYAFDFAAINFDDAEVFGGGINTDAFASLTFGAKRGSALAYTVRIGRYS